MCSARYKVYEKFAVIILQCGQNDANNMGTADYHSVYNKYSLGVVHCS